MLISLRTVTLRSIFVLTATVAVLVAYVSYKTREQRRSIRVLEEHGARVFFDWEDRASIGGARPTVPAPLWLRRLLGNEIFQNVRTVTALGVDRIDDSVIEAIDHLSPSLQLIAVSYYPEDLSVKPEFMRAERALRNRFPGVQVIAQTHFEPPVAGPPRSISVAPSP